MKILFILEICVVFILLIYAIQRAYRKHKDKNKVKRVLHYLEKRAGNVEVEKLQKMLGVDYENTNKNK